MTDVLPRLATALADRYRLERELGQGGMATVYLAEDLKHRRKVAIKVLRPELAAVIGAGRFLAEIQTTANLQHPHILPLHDSGEVDGTVFYVMPYVEGESLRDRLDREKQLPVSDAVRIATEVAGALDYAHRHGVIHRDIKPENILLHDGRAQVADFGIALAASRTEGSSRLTETGMSLGTPHYMSPEQALGERDLDGRADVYALGCVLYEMLTGEPPFDGPTAQAIIAKVMSSDPVPVTQLRRTVPPHVAAATQIALQKIPADRFATPSAMVEALQDSSRPLAAVSGGPALGPRQRVLRAIPWAVAVGAVLVAWLAVRNVGDAPMADGAVRFAMPPASGEDYAGSVAIAANGRFIIYSATRDGVTRLYQRFLDDPNPRPLPGTEGAGSPAVSPDGRWLAFVGSDQNLYKLLLDGGSRVLLAQTPNPPVGIGWSRSHGLVLGMLAFSRTVDGLSLAADTPGSVLRTVTEADRPGPGGAANNMHHGPFVPLGGDVALFENTTDWALGIGSLADGSWETLDIRIRSIVGWADGILLYLDRSDVLMAVGLDLSRRQLTGAPVRVENVPDGVRDAALAEDGTLVIRLQPGTYRVETVDEKGVGVPLLPDTVPWAIPRYAPDGGRALLGGNFRGATGAWMYDFRSGILSNLTPAFGRHLSGLEWTSDGRRALVTRFAGRQISWVATDGSEPLTVLYHLPDSATASTASLTADGRRLILGTQLGLGAANVHVARLDGDSTLQPFAAGPANETAPRLSPDGRWLAYASDESGRYEVYVRPFPDPGPRVQLSDAGGGQPVWSRDGRRLFYRVGRALMAVDLPAAPGSAGLRVTGRRPLFEGDFADVDPASSMATYDVAPDGRHFLMARALGGSRAQLVVWVNWLGQLKAQVRSR